MADRSLRGMRLGSQSLQSDEGVALMPRIRRTYVTPDGDTFELTFAAEADPPETWDDPHTGKTGVLLDEAGKLVQSEAADEKAARTPWDMLLERRTIPELEELLEERLEYLRRRRGRGDDPEVNDLERDEGR